MTVMSLTFESLRNDGLQALCPVSHTASFSQVFVVEMIMVVECREIETKEVTNKLGL